MEAEVEQLQLSLNERATELFNLCDQEGLGYITKQDLAQVIHDLELSLDSSQIEQAFDKLDEDNNGFLTLEEFTSGFGLFLGVAPDENAKANLQELESDPGKELFYLCDPEGKGYITKADLERVANDLSLNFEQLDVIFDHLDTDGNGQLTLDEFSKGFGKFLSGESTRESIANEPELIEPGKDSMDGINGRHNLASESANDVFESAVAGDCSTTPGQDDAVFREIIGSVGEDVFSGALSREQLKDLWITLQANDSQGLQKFEDFLQKVVGELRQAQNDSAQLETALKSKMNSHDTEVMRLYEEMEQQIKVEKDKVHQQQMKREKQLKDELMRELEAKDFELHKLMNKQKLLEELIDEKTAEEVEIKSENEKLIQKTMSLEEQLIDSVSSLEDTRQYVSQLQAQTTQEKKERARAALRVTEGMKKEQESLVKQLDMLRDMNQKLRDDKDTIEAAHQARKHKKVDRQGSNMAKYFGGKHKVSSSHSPKLRRQGTFQSIGEERDADGESEEGQSSKHKRKGSHEKSSIVDPDVLQLAVQEGVEFEGDVELGKIATEVKPEDERPAWAHKIMALVDAKEKEKAVQEATLRQVEGVEGDANTAEESETTTTGEGSEDVFEEEDQVQVFTKKKGQHTKATEEGSEDVFDEEDQVQVFRKKKAQITTGKVGEDQSKQYSDLSTAAEDTTDNESSGERPTSPRAAPVGKDDEIAPSRVQEPLNPATAQPDRVFKVVFVGDSGVGKSSFIHRLCHDQWKRSFTATIGVDFQIKTVVVNGRCIAIQLWDTAGQERYRSITKQYFRKADGFLVFYDVTMESSFINLKSWMTSVEEWADDRSAVMVIGSKTDLAEESNFRAVKTEDAEKLAESYKALYIETSAKTGSNIAEAIQKLAEVLQDREDHMIEDALLLTDKGKKKCCKSS